jgi:hypothetical protein
MSRDSGNRLLGTDFVAAISDQNFEKSAKICGILLVQFRTASPGEDELLGQALANRYLECRLVVASILQRAEKLHQKPPTAIDATAGCRFGFARLKGATRPPVRLTCTRTSAGARVTIRSTNRKRKLRSVIGSSPSLIIGRLRSTTEPVQAGDRVNVRWTTSKR